MQNLSGVPQFRRGVTLVHDLEECVLSVPRLAFDVLKRANTIVWFVSASFIGAQILRS